MFWIFLMIYLSPTMLLADAGNMSLLSLGKKYDLFSVSFPNETDGWVCGRMGIIGRTADGGDSWEQQKSGTDHTLASIYFLNSKLGWAVGDFGTILRTTDGGITWKKQKSPVQHWLFDVHFSDPDTGWISAERTTILHTTDGGKNWRIQLQAQEEEVALQSISFVSDKIGWAVGEYGYIYHTKDGGETWVPQAGHFDIDEGGDLVGDVFLFSVAAVDEQTVYAVGIEGHALKSKNGGQSWSLIGTDLPKKHLLSVFAGKADIVIIGGEEGLFISRDEGLTFQDANVTPPKCNPSKQRVLEYSWIGDITGVGENAYVAVGKDTGIYIFQGNAKDSWQKVESE